MSNFKIQPGGDAGDVCVQLIVERAQIPLSRDEWNSLVARNDINTVFQTFEWFDAWWTTFGDIHRLFFLLVRRDDRILGFAALMLKPIGLGAHQLEFVGTGNADYQDIVAAPENKRQVVDAICEFLSRNAARWRRARLCNIPDRSTTATYLPESSERVGLYLVHEAQMPCPALTLSGEHVRKRIDKYSVRRPLNWFSQRGEVRFRHVAQWHEIESLLPTFFDQHIRRWAKVGSESLFRDPKQRQFYMSLARAGHEHGWLLFSTVEFDGEPIAFHFGFDYAKTVTWYKPSFEIRFSERSPGMVLIHQLIHDSLARERHELDFTVGGEPFKERFANVTRRNLFLGIYHARSTWLLALAVRRSRRALGRLWRRLHRWPPSPV